MKSDTMQWVGDIYSNFDHTFSFEDAIINDAEELKTVDGYGIHSAWNFNGRIYFERGCFYEEIWQHHFLVEVLKSDTIEGVIKKANDGYGYE